MIPTTEVQQATQLPSRQVALDVRDGRRLVTAEPQIDHACGGHASDTVLVGRTCCPAA
jgi:hypothetical protein